MVTSREGRKNECLCFRMKMLLRLLSPCVLASASYNQLASVMKAVYFDRTYILLMGKQADGGDEVERGTE